MITFSHVYKTYNGPVHALKDINLQVEKGEFVFLTGPSGSGKTTFFRLLSAFDKPTSGRVTVSDSEIGRMTSDEVAMFRRRIGVVFQDFRLLKGRTAFDNVALPLLIAQYRPLQIKKMVGEMLDLVGLKFKTDQPIEQLSGGEQQRVAIARALAHRPGLLIADEPTGSLDPEMSAEIMKLFEKSNAQGTTVVIATHDLELVKRMGKREIKLINGAFMSTEGTQRYAD